MIKIKNLLLLLIAGMTLSACDFSFGGGGDKEDDIDPNLYTLELRVNMQDEEFQNIGLEYEPMDEEEMDYYVQEYGSKGITKENLQKVGTFENGKYYFMNNDGFYLKAPMVVGYEMTGWYDGNTRIDGGIDYTYDGKTDYLINMPGKNTILEARYVPVNYKFRMASHFDNEIIPSEQKTWNITMGDFVLDAPTVDGKNFVQWNFNGYYFNHAEGLVNAKQGEQLDPRCYKTIENVTKIDKDFLLQLGDVAFGYCADFETDLSAIYETQKCTATVKWVGGVDASFFIQVNHEDLFGDGYHWIQNAIDDAVEGATNPLTFTCNYGDQITIYYSLSDGSYNFDGFFVDNAQNPVQTTSSYTFTITKNIVVEMKLSAIE